MRRQYGFMLVAAAVTLTSVSAAQQPMEASQKVAGGGIFIDGWVGKIDSSRENTGLTISDAKLVKMGPGMHVTTGPSATYWNPANTASGTYTVKAKFSEAKYMNLNDHPHPYGIMIAGNDLGTANQSFLYCAAYGNGSFIVRGFGPASFRMNGGRGEMNAAVNKAAGKDQPVTQEIAVTVKPDVVECAINGTVVGSYPKADLVTAGKLKSTDGVYGLRFGHNTDAHVSDFGMTKGIPVGK